MKQLNLSVLSAVVSISTAAIIGIHDTEEATRFDRITGHRRQATPEGCRALSIDAEFPAPDVWENALPGIQPRMTGPLAPTRPDYRFTAMSTEDVEKAVTFAAQNNVRLTVIASGHDYMGRNDAPSGLSLDVSQLRGVKVLPSFTPTSQGAVSPDPAAPVNIITPIPGQQAAVTFGCGVSGYQVNKAINDSQLFIVTGSSPSVSVAGGWGQTGGHSLVSPQYGIGVDQFLEFKVVTADGQLQIANNISNPDLFWALRGGGGGNFGVVTEVTVKAHPQVPITGHLWVLSSQSDTDEWYDAISYMASEFPNMVEMGMSGYFIPLDSRYICFSLFVGENATEEYATSIWNPVLEKVSTFNGTQQSTPIFFNWPSFQGLFSDINPWVQLPKRDTGSGGVKEILENLPKGTLSSVGDSSSLTDLILDLSSRINSKLTDRGALLGFRDFLAPLYPRYTLTGDYNSPTPVGKTPIDSRLLAAKHLQSLPSQSMDVKRLYGRFVHLAVSGNKAHRPDDDVSALPAWREAYVHCLNFYDPPTLTADILREIAPDTGAYMNEAYWANPDWKDAFWGANYPRLSDLKTKYDPSMVFYNTPGINADLMEVRDGRLCQTPGGPVEGPGDSAPEGDNQNKADIVQNVLSFIEDQE